MIAKDMMPWLFVGRKSAWTPFAKVRCEGNVCRWTKEGKPAGKRKASNPRGFKAFLSLTGD
jgi:hypothetical protein